MSIGIKLICVEDKKGGFDPGHLIKRKRSSQTFWYFRASNL